MVFPCRSALLLSPLLPPATLLLLFLLLLCSCCSSAAPLACALLLAMQSMRVHHVLRACNALVNAHAQISPPYRSIGSVVAAACCRKRMYTRAKMRLSDLFGSIYLQADATRISGG